jgi:dynein heavy chain
MAPRTGIILGPPPGKQLIFFMDDLNMPKVDVYGTQSPICLIRQIIDYSLIFNREHLEEKKKLIDIMFLACMNPKSGSFNVDTRMSRHFTLIALTVPEKEILLTIYKQIFEAHLSTFDGPCQKVGPQIVSATAVVFASLANSPQFMPTAMKFHYQFNMRDFAKIIQNLTLAQASTYKGNALGLVRMWAHECHRVWQDRLLFDTDREAYMNFMRQGLKEFPDNGKEETVMELPLIYTSFMSSAKGHEASYAPIADMDSLREVLEQKMDEYNENVSAMDLVLFNQAMEHITRICRIIYLPGGNGLLVGVGGSGKQSLSKLASFILEYNIFRITVATNY